MSVTLQIEKMTLEEKLQTMEALWAGLSRNASDVVSPPWHETALKETEARYAVGKEGVSDWDEVRSALGAEVGFVSNCGMLEVECRM